MADPEHPQIYLITPPQFELSAFSSELSRMLDSFAVACVRLRCASEAAADIGRAADNLREVCHTRDVPLVVENHGKIASVHGLDGVHLTDGPRQVRDMRKLLGDDAIVGSFCENSRHIGMAAGEAGADYIAFGPLAENPLSVSDPVDFDTFEWWSEMIEIPVVAEGAISLDLAAQLAPVTDFFAFGPEVWSAENGPDAALKAYLERIM
ncbi:thiamine phosphate synthase [Neptunicoccus cionae]|uniref:Thiamine phosphate synthase n=1 Tax=Neptunicoccus cionae TaxID=2035344 RepID=A0A916VP63_9RHOB|nr:thiamine phosphate synthase [Amylibacter cionae]GGA14538.1 thiamine phosphate synthase [Amylibacter cionae]